MRFDEVKLLSSIFFNGYVKTQGGRLDGKSLDKPSRSTQELVFSLICAAACTMPVCLIKVLGHVRVAKKSVNFFPFPNTWTWARRRGKLVFASTIFAHMNSGSPACHSTHAQNGEIKLKSFIRDLEAKDAL